MKLGPIFRLDDEQRQTLTLYSVMAGTMALTVCATALVWIIRYGWPDRILERHAGELIADLFHITLAVLILMGIMIVAQAVITIGGKVKANVSRDGVSFEAEPDQVATRVTTTTTVAPAVSVAPAPTDAEAANP